ncbi:hypothetical protein AJ80_09185 [Polytolypa hystricis UAMH7299]|uniref:Aminoacyl-tRNA synthetase class Ia domain-containing protein n=1 Tax=Polytolypa hystricis (strain UAMH7299) TaxID=1447883 RepID=A0A2B7WUS6_POLH7|nr:hypothetical protein AJ80_09185 [Polytolypa hystricis UAMH7299]
MPYSTALCTPLSNFEATQNFKDAQDPSIVVSFPLVDSEHKGASLLVWTTTSWTLLSNLAIACNPEYEYIKVLDKSTNNLYILLEVGLSILFKNPKKARFKIDDKFLGKDMAAFGQEDYDTTLAAGIISPTQLPPNPVNKKAASHHKSLTMQGSIQITHSVGFCWHSDTPLIRKAVSSWFVKVGNSILDMLFNLNDTNWVPLFVKEK